MSIKDNIDLKMEEKTKREYTKPIIATTKKKNKELKVLVFILLTLILGVISLNLDIFINKTPLDVSPGDVWISKIELLHRDSDTPYIAVNYDSVYEVKDNIIYYIQNGIDSMECDYKNFKYNAEKKHI